MIFFLKVWCLTDRADLWCKSFLLKFYIEIWNDNMSSIGFHKQLYTNIWSGLRQLCVMHLKMTQLFKTVMILMNYFDSSLLKKVPKGSQWCHSDAFRRTIKISTPPKMLQLTIVFLWTKHSCWIIMSTTQHALWIYCLGWWSIYRASK